MENTVEKKSTAAASPSGPAGLAAGVWALEAGRSRFEFRVRHFWGLMTVRGQITRAEGTAEVGADGAIAATLSLDAASLDTKQGQRDKHLRSKDFFDVANHPTVTFTSKQVTGQGTDRLDVQGELSIAGHSQSITFEARLSEASGKSVTVDAEVSVDRTAFGMTWSPLGMAAPTSVLVVHAQFTKQ